MINKTHRRALRIAYKDNVSSFESLWGEIIGDPTIRTDTIRLPSNFQKAC